MESKSYYNPKSLYSHCVASYVKHLKPKTSQLDEIDGLQTLPPNILADIYLAVSWKWYSTTVIWLNVVSVFFRFFSGCLTFNCYHAQCTTIQILLLLYYLFIYLFVLKCLWISSLSKRKKWWVNLFITMAVINNLFFSSFISFHFSLKLSN